MAPNAKFLRLVAAKYYLALDTARNIAATAWPNMKNSLFIVLLTDANLLLRKYSSKMRRMNDWLERWIQGNVKGNGSVQYLGGLQHLQFPEFENENANIFRISYQRMAFLSVVITSASGINPSLLLNENMKADVYYLLLRRLKRTRRLVTVLLSVI
jgi:hypothetical protein